jgi:hypothetical protein
MIDIKELRIGNLVNRPFYNPCPKNEGIAYEICTIDFISRNKVNVKIKKNRIIKYNIADLTPVEITEDLLLKLGFELNYNSAISRKFNLKKDCRFDYSFSTVASIHNSGFRFKGSYFDIKYIHRLQNFYFALTNEELILNINN